MPNLSVKDVPEHWAEALRQRAARNHRSLQGELMAILERAATEASPAAALVPDGAQGRVSRDASGRSALQRGTKTIEQIFGEHLARFPQPIQGMRAVDLIREDRDAR